MNTFLKLSWMALLAFSLPAAEPAPPAKPHTNGNTVSTTIRAGTTNYSNDMTKAIYQNAVEAGDREVMEAAEYNLLHLEAVAGEDAAARAALAKLASLGDEFTLDWLGRPQGVTAPAERRPLIQSTLQQIRARLKTSPVALEKQARNVLLRAAVSDLSCNLLEVQIGRYRHSWLSRHSTNAAVRIELNAWRHELVPEGKWPEPRFIRRRAVSYINVGPDSPERSPATRNDQ